MLNKVKLKTRLTQNKKAKQTSNAFSKTRKGREREREKKKLLNHLMSFSFHTLEEPFRLANP